MRLLSRRRMLGLAAISALAVLNACGEGESTRSAATSGEQIVHQVLTEADAGKLIATPFFSYDIGLPDQKGLEIEVAGDDDSTLRWRFAQKPDPYFLEWHAVDGQPAFETDGLIGDPATAAKVLEFRGVGKGETSLVLELVERDSSKRGDEPARRLEYFFETGSITYDQGVW